MDIQEKSANIRTEELIQNVDPKQGHVIVHEGARPVPDVSGKVLEYNDDLLRNAATLPEEGEEGEKDAQPVDTSLDFNEELETKILLRDVMNELPIDLLFQRETAVHSNKAFMLFREMWSIGIFAVHKNQEDESLTVSLAQ